MIFAAATFIAQVQDYAPLLQFGIAGVMLAWFMFRVEKRLEDHTGIIGDLAKSILIDVLSRDNVSNTLRHEAEQAKTRIDQRAQRQSPLR